MPFWTHRGTTGASGAGKRRLSDGRPERFVINPDAMLAILPNPVTAEIVFYALDGRNFVMSFASAGDDHVVMSLVQRGSDRESVPLFETRMSQADGRLLWWQFCDGTIPVPGVLSAALTPAKPRSRLSAVFLLGIGLMFGSFVGWVVAGGTWSVVERVALVSGEPALPALERPPPAMESLGMTAPAVSAPVPAFPPVAASPALGGMERGGEASTAPVMHQVDTPSALLALRELRLALQDGRPVSPDLFRRLPEDVQRLLVAEGLADGMSASPSEPPSAEPARLPTGAVLRGGSDPHGVPLVPRRLPPGVSEGALPPVGGGDLHGPRDFEAFGLRPAGR